MRFAALTVVLLSPLSAATLQRLTLDEMIAKSTAIVHAKIGPCEGKLRGTIIYTNCQLAILEQWKGSPDAATKVLIPGGVANGVRHVFSGAPALAAGEERVLFLWAGQSGEPQVIGLSQGLMKLERLSDGTVMAVRAPVRDRMLDTEGRPVWDEGVEMPLTDLRKMVRQKGDR